MTESDVLAELNSDALAALVKDIGIPPRPSLLAELQKEVQRDEPRVRVLAGIAAADVAMSAALLKTANSPLLGLRRRAETVLEAFMLLGFHQCHVILTEISLRDLLVMEAPAMVRFWDVSSKRAHAMAYLARTKRVSTPAQAHTYGLFVDVGIPVLMRRFQHAPMNYLETLALANQGQAPFTAVERQRHQADHAVVGAMLARSWGVSQTVLLATWLHHDYHVWEATKPAPLPPSVRELMALGLVAETIIQRYQGLNQHAEWARGGELAMKTLGLDEATLDAWCSEVHDRFNGVE